MTDETAIRCAHCHGAVTLTLEELPRRAQRVPQAWICPYCFKRNEGTFAALLKTVMKR